MTIAEKVKSKQPISRDEFRSLVKKTNWSDYSQRVAMRIAKISIAHEICRFRSLANGHNHIYN